MKKIKNLKKVALLFSVLTVIFYISCEKSKLNDFPTSASESQSFNSNNENPETSKQANKDITIVCCWIARKKFDCETGGCLCHCRIGFCPESSTTPGNPPGIPFDRKRMAQAEIRMNSNGQLEMKFTNELPEQNLIVFEMDEELELPQSVASVLGYRTMKIHKGSYNMDYSNDPFGEVTVNVSTTN